MHRFLIIAGGAAMAATTHPAYAECTVPHEIANGQVADASQVMDNFNSIANCTDAAITASGIPQVGEIAVVSGPKSLTGGDLSGDVTTSGSTLTTLANTGVAAGNYVDPNITIDAKGRITSATNGSAGDGGTGWTELTLVNPGAESGDTTGWTMAGGGFAAAVSNQSGHAMIPIDGSYSFLASANANPQMYQVIDVTTFSSTIDAGSVSASVEAFAADTYSIGEFPYVYLLYRDASGTELAQTVSATQVQSIGNGKWRSLSATGRVPRLTRSIAIYVWAKRENGTNNNVAFDEIRAFIQGF